MKKLNGFKKFLALTFSALMLAAVPNANVLTASAEESTTYYVKYQEEKWCYQVGSTWDDSAVNPRDVYYMAETLKDGDTVIVGSGDSNKQLVINAHLYNLTINNDGGSFAMVSVTGGIDNCFFLTGSHGSVTGNVLNAHVYNTATANFNNNVTNLYSYNDVDGTGPTIGVSGTVSYYMSEDTTQANPPYGINFAANTFSLVEGALKTPEYNYTRAADGPIAANAPTTNTPTASQPASTSSSANEYDKVPKTGDTSSVMWLSLITISCFSASLLLKKAGNK